MRVALISDIHGNLVALETVLDDIRGEEVDEIICLGDVAAIGPEPHETLGGLRKLDCRCVMGNTDAELLQIEPAYHSGREEVDRRTQEVVAWCRAQLSPGDFDHIRSFQPTVECQLDSNMTLLCCHGSPKSYSDIILWTTPAAELDQMLGEVHATVLAGGHTHVQMVRRHRELMIVNAGSVGLPYDQNPWSDEVPQEDVRFAEWAEYALVSCRGRNLSVELRRVQLDLAQVADAAFKAGRPYAKQWVAAWADRVPLLASFTSSSASPAWFDGRITVCYNECASRA
jgi:putative phosphoesterase